MPTGDPKHPGGGPDSVSIVGQDSLTQPNGPSFGFARPPAGSWYWNVTSSPRTTLRIVLRAIFISRAIVFTPFLATKYSRLIFAIVSTTNILPLGPTSNAPEVGQMVNPRGGGHFS